MSLPETANVPDNWWRRLLDAEQRMLGGVPDRDERELWLSVDAWAVGALIPDRLRLAVERRSLRGDLRAEAAHWPLRDDSVDRVVLQHALEVAEDPDAVLDEAVRILKPERSLVLLAVGAFGWTRCKLRFGDCGAPHLRIVSAQILLHALAQRDCVDLRVSRIEFDGRADARTCMPARMWSGLCLIEARKRRQLPNVRRLRVRHRIVAPASGWIARPSSRNGLAA